ncbi:MAG: glycosyltransferase family 4 protein [Candidatus Aenigmarchaeota archaeon]|nr:glycosyltransferase family 4 protein [Candidatus Aenigmarchaeota archaeon]
MRPCFVTTSFSASQHNSGISNALYLLARYLHEEKGIDSTVFAPIQKWGKKDEDSKSISIKRFPTRSLLNFSYSSELAGRIMKEHMREKFDLVHSYHFGFFPATAGFNFAKSNGLSHFLTAAFHPPASKFKRILMSSYNYTHGKTLLSGSSVFPFNKNEKEQLSKYTRFRSKIIPCPVNDEIFYPRKGKFPRTTIAFLGTFLPWKGPQIALDIFNEIGKERKDVDFILMGTGPLENELRAKAGPNVRVMAGLPSEKVASILSMSDIVVSPTLYESFGSSIAEAMMCGTPVVSTRVGAVPETIGPGGILVDYGDWEEMKKQIDMLIEDDNRRKKLAQLAVRHSNNYKFRKVGKEIYKAYLK